MASTATTASIGQQTSAPSAIITAEDFCPGPAWPLREFKWDIPKLSRTFPNVFISWAYGSSTIEQRFERIKNGVLRYNYDKDETLVTPGAEFCATIKASLLPPIDGTLPDDNERIVLILEGFYLRAVAGSTILIYLVDKEGTPLLVPSSVVMFGAAQNQTYTSYCHITSTIVFRQLLSKSRKFILKDTLRVRIKVIKPQLLSHRSINLDMLNLLKTGDKSSDFTIKCGSSVFKVHGLILGARSPVFKAMLSTDMLEKNEKEATISDMEPDAFRMLLQYIYSSTLEIEKLGYERLKELIQAAEKYQIAELKNICFSILIEYISLGHIMELAVMAHRYKAKDWIRSKVFDFCIKHFADLRTNPKFKGMVEECFNEFFLN